LGAGGSDGVRIVIRNRMSRDLSDLLVADLKNHIAYLDQLEAPLPQRPHEGFHH
jgi:hypothetical protein